MLYAKSSRHIALGLALVTGVWADCSAPKIKYPQGDGVNLSSAPGPVSSITLDYSETDCPAGSVIVTVLISPNGNEEYETSTVTDTLQAFRPISFDGYPVEGSYQLGVVSDDGEAIKYYPRFPLITVGDPENCANNFMWASDTYQANRKSDLISRKISPLPDPEDRICKGLQLTVVVTSDTSEELGTCSNMWDNVEGQNYDFVCELPGMREGGVFTFAPKFIGPQNAGYPTANAAVSEFTVQPLDRVMACALTVMFPPIAPTYFSQDTVLFNAAISYDAEYCSELHFQSFISRSEPTADFDPVFIGTNPSFTFGDTGSDNYEYNIARGDMKDQGLYEFGGKMFLNDDFSDDANSIGVGNEADFTVTIISPDTNQCSQSITFPYAFPLGQQGSIDFPSTSTANFRTRVDFSRDGVCGTSQYLDLTLRNSNGASYPCSRISPPSNSVTAVTCNVPAGSMSTLVTWQFESTQPESFKRDTDPNMLYLTNVPTFTITHSDDPQATGGMRRRQRQVQAGLLVPSDVQCRPGHDICPVAGRLGSWECLDTANLLDACGGCPHSGGKDCTDIPGITRVKCQVGVCIVQECDDQHTLTRDRSGCVPRTNSIRWSAI